MSFPAPAAEPRVTLEDLYGQETANWMRLTPQQRWAETRLGLAREWGDCIVQNYWRTDAGHLAVEHCDVDSVQVSMK